MMTDQVVPARKRFVALVAIIHDDRCVHVDFSTINDYEPASPLLFIAYEDNVRVTYSINRTAMH